MYKGGEAIGDGLRNIKLCHAIFLIVVRREVGVTGALFIVSFRKDDSNWLVELVIVGNRFCRTSTGIVESNQQRQFPIVPTLDDFNIFESINTCPVFNSVLRLRDTRKNKYKEQFKAKPGPHVTRY